MAEIKINYFDKPAKPTGTFIVQHHFFFQLMTARDVAHLVSLRIKMCIVMAVLVIINNLKDNNNSFSGYYSIKML